MVGNSPFDWLDQFFGNCTGCKFDFMPAHYYACTPTWLYGMRERETGEKGEEKEEKEGEGRERGGEFRGRGG